MLNRCHGFQCSRHAAAALGLLGLISGFSLVPAKAEDAATYFKGKTVHFVVGYSPGGGFDTYARMLAPHFEKRTGATVVVDNKPGAGGITALNQMVHGVADGLTFQMLHGDASIMSQLIDRPGVAYDMSKLSMIARVHEEPYFILFNNSVPGSLREIIASGKQVKFSAGSRTDGLGSYAAAVCQALKMNCQIITGYKGSKGASLAMLNGEADALAVSESSGLRYASNGKARIMITIGHERSKHKPDVPTVYEAFELSPQQKWWLDFQLSISSFGRAIVGPPGIPADRLNYLQKVWKEILNDPAVVGELAKRKRGISYAPPSVLKKAIDNVFGALVADQKIIVQEVYLKKFSP